uniref:SET domain-containing protein n=1 Tax=Ditylenchus dipsaci TaxID=166011 RepID=A0A915D3T8_9BILA
MIYSVDDLSNGVESVPVKAVNQYTFEKIAPFKYMKTTRIDPSCEQYFQDNQGCKCVECDEGSCCACCQAGSIGGGKYEYLKMCDKSTCSCPPEKCKNRDKEYGANEFQLNAALEVFFVSPKRKDKESMGDSVYIFRMNFGPNSFAVDAGPSGNVARFINHSCEPNLDAPMILHGQKMFPRLCFFSMREIPAGEELTIDYGQMW